MLNFSELRNLHQSKKAYFFFLPNLYGFCKAKKSKILCLEPKCAGRQEAGEWYKRGFPTLEAKNLFGISFCLCQAVGYCRPPSPITSSQSSGCKSRTAHVVPLKEVGAFHCRIYMGWGCPRGRETECSGVSRSYFLKQRRKGKLGEEASLFLALNTLIGGKGS